MRYTAELRGWANSEPVSDRACIAKAVEGKLTDATLHTGLQQFIGTPAYMSPEQAQMSPDIDTRTVDTHMRRLREKLGPPAQYLDTVRGVGYRFRDTEG